MTTRPIIVKSLIVAFSVLLLFSGCNSAKSSWKAVSQKHLESHLAKHNFLYNSAFVNNAGLIEIDARGCPISDISCLESMPLEVLILAKTQVADLGPLQELRTLKKLDLSRTLVANLNPLENLNIERLDISATRVTELSSLRKLRISFLNLANTRIIDLSPINVGALKTLNLVDADMYDLSPLSAATLESIYFSPQHFSGTKEQLQVLRNMKTLTCINFYSNPKQFWKEYDAGKLSQKK